MNYPPLLGIENDGSIEVPLEYLAAAIIVMLGVYIGWKIASALQ